MIHKICLLVAALAILSAPAFAQEKCDSPIAPKVPNGKTASVAELIQSNKDVVAFIKDSDQFQSCLLAAVEDIDKQSKDNDASKHSDATVRRQLADEKKKILAEGDANQKEKERVGKEYNTAAAQYKAAHPK